MNIKYKIYVKISNGLFGTNMLSTVFETDVNIHARVRQQFREKQEYIIFGDLGVKRELIDWYTIKDIDDLEENDNE
jgi:exonuclease III